MTVKLDFTWDEYKTLPDAPKGDSEGNWPVGTFQYRDEYILVVEDDQTKHILFKPEFLLVFPKRT